MSDYCMPRNFELKAGIFILGIMTIVFYLASLMWKVMPDYVVNNTLFGVHLKPHEIPIFTEIANFTSFLFYISAIVSVILMFIITVAYMGRINGWW